MSQTKHEFQIYWIVHFEERIPKNLETLLFYTKKTLACCYRKQLPAREVTAEQEVVCTTSF